MCVEWITFTPPQDSFERPLLEKTKPCAMVLHEKVGEGFLRALKLRCLLVILTFLVLLHSMSMTLSLFIFFSMACTGLKWIEKKKKVFDSDAQKNINCTEKHQHVISSARGYSYVQQWHE
jgi:hypothetical protein